MKNFSKLLAALFCACLVFSCATTGSQSAGSAATGGASGTATGTAPGYGGDVTVTITMVGGTITDVVVEGPGETPAIGGRALTTAPASIKRYNSHDIDAISGVTVTVMAIREAARLAIEQIQAGL